MGEGCQRERMDRSEWRSNCQRRSALAEARRFGQEVQTGGGAAAMIRDRIDDGAEGWRIAAGMGAA